MHLLFELCRRDSECQIDDRAPITTAADLPRSGTGHGNQSEQEIPTRRRPRSHSTQRGVALRSGPAVRCQNGRCSETSSDCASELQFRSARCFRFCCVSTRRSKCRTRSLGTLPWRSHALGRGRGHPSSSEPSARRRADSPYAPSCAFKHDRRLGRGNLRGEPALLGLRKGDRMPFRDNGTGCEHVIEIADVGPPRSTGDAVPPQPFDRLSR